MASDRILEQLRRPVEVDECSEIREFRKACSIAEDSRDLPGPIASLGEGWVYEAAGTGTRRGTPARELEEEMVSPDLPPGGSA